MLTSRSSRQWVVVALVALAGPLLVPTPAFAATEVISAQVTGVRGTLEDGRCHLAIFIQYPSIPGATAYEADYTDALRPDRFFISSVGPDTDESATEPFANGLRLPAPNDFLAGGAGPCDETPSVAEAGARFEIIEARVTLPDKRPTAAFTTSGNRPVSFDGGGSTGNGSPIQEWRWAFGDGETGSGETIEHAYAEPGTYEVMLTVVNEAGLADVDLQTVVVGGGTVEASVTYEVLDAQGQPTSVTRESTDGLLEGEIFDGDELEVTGEGWRADGDPIRITLDGEDVASIEPVASFDRSVVTVPPTTVETTSPEACVIQLEATQAEDDDFVDVQLEQAAAVLVADNATNSDGVATAPNHALCTGWRPTLSGDGLVVGDDAHDSYGVAGERRPDWTGWTVQTNTQGRELTADGVLTNYLYQRTPASPTGGRLVARRSFSNIGALPSAPTAGGLNAGLFSAEDGAAGSQLRLTTAAPQQVAGPWDRMVGRDISFLASDGPCRQTDPSAGPQPFTPFMAVNGSLFLGGTIEGSANIVARTVWLDAEGVVDPCSSNGTSPALSISAEMIIIGPIPGMQWTTRPTDAGDGSITLNGRQSFAVGDEVVIDPGSPMEENATLGGINRGGTQAGTEFTLTEPLVFAHQPGAQVINLTTPPPALPGIGVDVGNGFVALDRIEPLSTHPRDIAIAWSQRLFDDDQPGPDRVLVGTTASFADSLSSGGIQGTLGAPLLLDDPAGPSPQLMAEIQRLGARTVYLLGGPAALSTAYEEQMVQQGWEVNRLAGASRLETAVAITQALMPTASTAYLARAFGDDRDESRAFADSLAVGAAAAEAEVPVLLTQTEQLSTSTAAYLADSMITEVVIGGGTAAVSDEVVTDLANLGITSRRVAGPTRFDTALAVASERGFTGAADGAGVVLLQASGETAWVDGLVAALTAARERRPVVLAEGPSVGGTTASFLSGGLGDVLCGAISDDRACTASGASLAS